MKLTGGDCEVCGKRAKNYFRTYGVYFCNKKACMVSFISKDFIQIGKYFDYTSFKVSQFKNYVTLQIHLGSLRSLEDALNEEIPKIPDIQYGKKPTLERFRDLISDISKKLEWNTKKIYAMKEPKEILNR